MKPNTAIKFNLVWFRAADLKPHWSAIREKLQSRSRYKDDEEEDKPIRTWATADGKQMIGLPLHYGVRVAKYLGFSIEDKTTEGKAATYPSRPTPRNEKQEQFFKTLLSSARKRDTVLAVAPTGTGKTVAGLNTVAELGRAALIVVPSRNLASQWAKEVQRHLGLSMKRIHIFQGGKCSWEGYHVVIAVIHNLCERKWPNEFYNHFGTVVWDEAHRVGARVFSKSLKKFPARHRIALTATPDRKDGRTSILHQAFGPPAKSVKGNKMKALPCTVYVVHTKSKVKARSWGSRMMQMGGLISAIAADDGRNNLITNIVARGFKAGRDILVLSDRIEHLKSLKTLLEAKGIPSKDMGLFIGSASEARLDDVKRTCRIILATYGMMKEGQDVPRLNMGIDATPRSEGVQAIGRIRREWEGKGHPIWVTLFDANGSSMLQGISGARIKDYKSCGARVEQVGHNLNAIPF